MKVKFFSFNEDQNKIIDAILAHNKDFVAVENNYELVVVIGGDGTFLHALNFFKHEDVKIVLINNGKLGFFSNINDDYKIELDDSKFASYPILNLSCEHHRLSAMNEFILIAQNNPIKFDVLLNDHYWYTSFGSGFMVSTKNGSSGVNRSLRGPLLTNDNQFIYQEYLPVISSQTISVLQPVVFNYGDELKFKIHDPENNTLSIKVDGVLTNWSDLKLKIHLTKSIAKIYHLNNQEWINRINQKMLGEK
mgnify:CR=1 FL=1